MAGWPTGAGWSRWPSSAGPVTSWPWPACWPARGTDGALWHIWQTAPNNGWSGWASLGGVISSDPEVARNADGRLEAFARGLDNAVWHIWQTAPNKGWSGWGSLGGILEVP